MSGAETAWHPVVQRRIESAVPKRRPRNGSPPAFQVGYDVLYNTISNVYPMQPTNGVANLTLYTELIIHSDSFNFNGIF